jgi:hypothetical protein
LTNLLAFGVETRADRCQQRGARRIEEPRRITGAGRGLQFHDGTMGGLRYSAIATGARAV